MLSDSLQERGGPACFNVIEPEAGEVAIYNSSVNLIEYGDTNDEDIFC